MQVRCKRRRYGRVRQHTRRIPLLVYRQNKLNLPPPDSWCFLCVAATAKSSFASPYRVSPVLSTSSSSLIIRPHPGTTTRHTNTTNVQVPLILVRLYRLHQTVPSGTFISDRFFDAVFHQETYRRFYARCTFYPRPLRVDVIGLSLVGLLLEWRQQSGK